LTDLQDPAGYSEACSQALDELFGIRSAANTPEGAATLADLQRMQQLAAAAEHLLKMCSRNLLLPNSITAYRHEQLRSSCLRVLQRVAAVATAQCRLVPWIDLLADQLKQQLEAMPAAAQEDQQQQLQTQQQQQQQPAVSHCGRLPHAAAAALQDWSSDDDESEAQQLPHTAADSARSPWASAITGHMQPAALQTHSHASASVSSVDGDDMPGGVSLIGTWDDEVVQQLLAAEDREEEHPDVKAAAEIVQLLECLQPLGTCRKGLLALVPYAELLQEAAAALQQQPVRSKRSCAALQDSMGRWAAQAAAAALAALGDAQREHLLACIHLRCEINHTASACSTQHEQQQLGQQRAEVFAAIDRLAVASSWVEELQQLLQLAGVPQDTNA
jgi:chemotaxis protein histidine kinase CheA